MERVTLVSSRLPVTVTRQDNDIKVTPSSGGLATGLSAARQRFDGEWIGWPGELPGLRTRQRARLEESLAESRLVPVFLTRSEVRGFYDEVSNGILWPLFHYQLDQMPPDAASWDIYRRVNEKFARAIIDRYRPGDAVWVHDYQLMLVPSLVRKELPGAQIGFFLHVPFPSSEVFSILPWREEILVGLLGADLIGFHAPSYLRHFTASVRRVLGLDVRVDRVEYQGRATKLGIHPMGVDAAAWANLAADPEVRQMAQETRREAHDRKLVVGIDRLDYTKGIPARLLAMEHLFQLEPSIGRHVRLVQVTVPSRENTESYARFGRRLDELVGRVNGAYATAGSVPIHHLHRSLSTKEVAALYLAADVMLVTPLRDGMNLVAKEFIASRTDGDGVLLISEFAGAAGELGDALHVNPYDVDAVARRLVEALLMPEDERRRRMRTLRGHVMSSDVHGWAQAFIGDLRAFAARRPAHAPLRSLPGLRSALREAPRLVLLLDYDGTLVPFADKPQWAGPDAELLGLLRRLATRAATDLHIVSGRTRRSLENWLGALPIGLHAEHGLWSRLPHAIEWEPLANPETDWKNDVRPMLEHFARTTEGSFVEEKTAALAWHYRTAIGDEEFAELQARELRLLLAEALANAPLDVHVGHKVVEVRTQGVNKGLVVRRVLEGVAPDAVAVAIGDDETDEDLFAALPSNGIAVRVGAGATQASIRLADHAQVREVLASLLDGSPAGLPQPPALPVPEPRRGAVAEPTGPSI